MRLSLILLATACSRPMLPPADGGVPDAGTPDSGAMDSGAADSGAPDPCGPLTSTLTRCAANPVLLGYSLGPDLTPYVTARDPSVLFDESDHLWKMWFSSSTQGCIERSDSYLEIFYADSRDGVSWSPWGYTLAPLYSGYDGGWDSRAVRTPSVIRLPQNPPSQRFALLYGGADAGVGLAFSSDGRQFTRLPASQSPFGRDGLVIDTGITEPNVVVANGNFHLFGSAPAGIVHETSSDLIHWTASVANPVIAGGAHPAVFVSDSGFEMYLSVDSAADVSTIPFRYDATLGFFHATSADGDTWQVPSERELTWDPDAGGESLGLFARPAVARVGNQLWLYYGGWVSDRGNWCEVTTGDGGVIDPFEVMNVARMQLP